MICSTRSRPRNAANPSSMLRPLRKALRPVQPMPAQSWQECVNKGKEYRTEYRSRVADGSYRTIEVRGVPLRNPDRTVREWIGANVDITERKRVEQELKASEHRRVMALSAARVGGFVWDPSTGESELTPELQKILGFEGSPEAGRKLDRWLANVHVDDKAMVLEHMRQSETSGSMDFEYRYHHPQGGIRWLHVK